MNRTVLSPVIVIVALLISFGLGAQRKSQETDQKPSQKESQKEARVLERDPLLKEIDKSWMAEIRGGASKPSAGAAQDGAADEAGKGRADNEDVKFNDPGAANGADKLFGPKEEGPSFISTVLRFVGLLAVMILGLYLIVRFMRMKNPSLMPTGDLAVVMATVPLVQGKFLQIVELAGRMVVLGVSDHGVNMIMPIDDAAMADKIRIWHSQKTRLVPLSLMDSLTKTFKKTDVKFWPSRTDGKPDKMARDSDFADVLRQFGGESRTSTPLDASTSASVEEPESPAAAIQALINRQKKKLDRLRHPESELPGMSSKA